MDANGQPFPILGRTAWALISLTQAAQRAFIDDTAASGYNTIEVAIPHKWPQSNQAPYANIGAYLPFTGTVGGSMDFTTFNEPYWAFADALIDYAASKGIAVLVFPCYNGIEATGVEGWMPDMVANGATRMQTYGQTLATRWATKKNIVWMLAGDYGSDGWSYTAPQAAVENAFITGLLSVTKSSNLYAAELQSDSTAADASTSLMLSTLNLNGAYSHRFFTTSLSRRAYSENRGPAFLLEGPYDEEGPDGNNVNDAATQPVRRFQWWAWLSAIGGQVLGNGYVWLFTSGYTSHLNTATTQDMTRMNAFIKSVEWWRLVPDGLGSIGTLVTAGKGTIDTTNYVTAAATLQGDLLIAYIGPGHSGSITVDMGKLRGTATARWFDPTSGTYTDIGSFANTGTRAFTPPGSNSAGAADWVLRIDA